MSSDKKSPNKKVENSSTNSDGSAGTSSSETGGGEKSLKVPENWETVYSNIEEMRKDRNAPVDSMGCERAHDPAADPKVFCSKKYSIK